MKTVSVFLAVCVLAVPAFAAAITGNPEADGWTFCGNSLENGVYVDGSANYGFDAYSAVFAVSAGSILEISDGANSWLSGDTVLAVGGVFTSTVPSWGTTGNAINSLLSSVSSGPKLQAKFGTSAATWQTSTAAPANGNANGSGSLGGGRVQIRTGTYYTAAGTDPGWSTDADILMPLAKDSHIEWISGGIINANMARMIWTYDSTTGKAGTWELLLNASLLARLNPSYTGLLPTAGDMVIMTVQNNDSSWTNALITTPEPATLSVLAIGGLALLRRKK